MAQVARRSRPQPDIDYHLDYQFDSWAGVVEYAELWPTMDPGEREVFHLEWAGITESRLRELQGWAEQGLMTPAQHARYQGLLKLVAQHRPLVERLLKDEAA